MIFLLLFKRTSSLEDAPLSVVLSARSSWQSYYAESERKVFGCCGFSEQTLQECVYMLYVNRL